MKTNASSQDICLFFFSGHGDYGPDVAPIDEADGKDEYLCPYDSLTYESEIRDDELDAWMSPITANKVLILDTCYAGGFVKGTAGLTIKAKTGSSYANLTDGFAKDINKDGFVVLASCNDSETSVESSFLQNGVFTYYLDQCLCGSADVNGDGVSAEEAFAYAAPRVINYTSNAQNPQLWDGIPGEVLLTPPPPSLGEAVDNKALSWTTGGTANWFGQKCIYYYGGDAARSGAITDNQSTWLRTTVTVPGTLNFYWKISSEMGYEYLHFYIDGIPQAQISVSADWQQQTYSIGSGIHVLEWRYTKDGSVTSGSDCGWLDKVEFTSLSTPTPTPTPTCSADFMAEPTSGVGATIVHFTDKSTGNVTGWAWDFNSDGVVDSTEQNPTHIFTRDGLFSVTLTITTPNCTDTLTKVDYISITGCHT